MQKTNNFWTKLEVFDTQHPIDHEIFGSGTAIFLYSYNKKLSYEKIRRVHFDAFQLYHLRRGSPLKISKT